MDRKEYYRLTRPLLTIAVYATGFVCPLHCVARLRSDLSFSPSLVGKSRSLFTAPLGMKTLSAMRILSVRPSVCPSVKRVDCDKPEERFVWILYHTKDHLV